MLKTKTIFFQLKLFFFFLCRSKVELVLSYGSQFFELIFYL